MRIAAIKERRPGEARVALSPETAKRLTGLGAEVVVEAGAGEGAAFPDQAYREAGARVVEGAAAALDGADVVLKVQRPILPGEDGADELSPMKRGAVLVGLLAPHDAPGSLARYAAAGIDAFAMELMPRITRAQTMDVLSSQSNLAGYKAVLEAAVVFGRAFPMMMTAAGTVAPARVCVLGAGVAGLQAIATAKRLGGIVSAFDVRAAVKEQVQSLGASFIEVEGAENLETAGGYAREASDTFQKRQAEKIHETLKKQDIVIATALIPGRPAPVLVTEAMVRDMKPGSVIVDLAVERGGNCALSEPGEVVVRHGVTIIGHLNMPSRIATDASQLYAKNLLNFLQPLIDRNGGRLAIDWNDEIVRGTALTRDGAVIHPAFAAAAAPAEMPAAPLAAEPAPPTIETPGETPQAHDEAPETTAAASAEAPTDTAVDHTPPPVAPSEPREPHNRPVGGARRKGNKQAPSLPAEAATSETADETQVTPAEEILHPPATATEGPPTGQLAGSDEAATQEDGNRQDS